MFSFPKTPQPVAAGEQAGESPPDGPSEPAAPLEAVAARIAAATERSLEEFLRERAARLKGWQQRRF